MTEHVGVAKKNLPDSLKNLEGVVRKGKVTDASDKLFRVDMGRHGVYLFQKVHAEEFNSENIYKGNLEKNEVLCRHYSPKGSSIPFEVYDLNGNVIYKE